LCLNGSVYTLYPLAHTMVLKYLLHHTHILSTVLTAHDTIVTQMCDALNNWLRQPSSFLVSSPLDISNFSFALFLGISEPSGSHVLGRIVEAFTNFVECMISLPKKPESFQRLLLDLHLVCSKQVINSLHIMSLAVLPVTVALVFCNFLVLLLLCILWCVRMPDTSSSPLVHHYTRI
jgi:hypothetical protein